MQNTKGSHQLPTNRLSAHIIQISGATVVSQDEIKAKNFGNVSDKQYGDLSDEQELHSIIEKHQNRAVDNYIQQIAKETPNVKTALVFPSMIYGKGSGPGNQRSIQVPELARIALQRKRAVHIGAGENVWTNIHISDLSAMLVRLVESAMSSGSNDEKNTWGANGLFFAGAHEGISFGTLARKIARAAHEANLIPGEEVDSISAGEADELSPHASAIVGTNARTLSERAQKVLSWNASGPSLEHEIAPTVLAEAKRLGLSS